jgi:hypothetical protein
MLLIVECFYQWNIQNRIQESVSKSKWCLSLLSSLTETYINRDKGEKKKAKLHLLSRTPWHKDVWGGVEVHVHIFLSSVVDGDKWSALRSECFTHGKTPPGTHWIRGCVSLRVGLDDAGRENLLVLSRIEPQFLGSPTFNLVTIPTEMTCLKYAAAGISFKSTTVVMSSEDDWKPVLVTSGCNSVCCPGPTRVLIQLSSF